MFLVSSVQRKEVYNYHYVAIQVVLHGNTFQLKFVSTCIIESQNIVVHDNSLYSKYIYYLC